MPSSIGSSRASTPSVYNNNPQQSSGASRSQTTHQPPTQASNPAADRQRALQARQRAMAWLENQTGHAPVLRMPEDMTASSSARRQSPEAADISYPPHIQAPLNELMEQGDIEPSDEDMEAAERGVQHMHQNVMPSVSVEQLFNYFRNRFPLAEQRTIQALAEAAHNRRVESRASENESGMHWPYKQIAIERLDNLGLQLVGTDPSKENEYKENCQELQEALRDHAMLGNITDKSYQAYSDRLSEMIHDMPYVIDETIKRQENVTQRVSELMSFGDIQPSAADFEHAERNIQDYLSSPDSDVDPEEREEDLTNFRNAPYVGIAQDRLKGLSNPPVDTDFGEQHEYIQGCNDLKRALKQKFDEGAINEKTYQAYKTALDIKTEDIVLTIEMLRSDQGF